MGGNLKKILMTAGIVLAVLFVVKSFAPANIKSLFGLSA